MKYKHNDMILFVYKKQLINKTFITNKALNINKYLHRD